MLNKKLDQLISDLKDEIGLLLSISFGIFLFVLFFQPFTFGNFDFNNSLLFVAGLGAIIFFSMVLVRITIPGLFRKENQDRRVLLLPAYFNGFMIVLLSSLAFVFYLRFVGMLNITFFLTIKIILICLAPPFILAVYDYVDELKQKNDLLLIERKSIQKQIEKYEEDFLNKSVTFNSENNSENFSLLISEVVFIKSADNYVEIIYREGDGYRKKLIRNTLRNVELQIRQYSNFIRCHRICIVNLHFVEKLIRDDNNHWLVIKGYEEKVPVSRQYLLKLREAI
jgi:DNA-binding LytR/AlgR family response regulator